jgi:hypothetical protein
MRFTVLIAAIVLAGCNTTSGSYVRLDGAAIDPTKYEVDQTVCRGQMAQAQMSGAVAPTGNMFEDANSEVQRDAQAGNVMLGCMAGKGYRFVTG